MLYLTIHVHKCVNQKVIYALENVTIVKEFN